MIVVPMDNQRVILGKDFLRLARAVPVPHEDCLLFENGTKMFGVSMTVKRKFRRVPRISSMTLLKGAKGG